MSKKRRHHGRRRRKELKKNEDDVHLKRIRPDSLPIHGFSTLSVPFGSVVELTSGASPLFLPPIHLHSPLFSHLMHSQLPGGSLSQPCLVEKSVGPTQILPFLFLGSQQDALNCETLKEHNIEYVLNLSINCPRASTVEDDDEHFMRIPVNDSYMDKLTPYFPQAFNFLERIREAKKVVLVHCLAGISRSPTMCISYIMRHLKMDSEDAYKFVKSRRGSISPNFNFMGQLLEYERKLRDEGLLPIKEPREKIEYSTLETSSLPTCCLAPAMKMPKSSSSHAIMTPSSHSRPSKVRSAMCTEKEVREEEEPEEDSPSRELNQNGKREMASTLRVEELLEEVQRPKVLLFRPRRMEDAARPASLLLPLPKNEELPSPSTEMSKLTFDPFLSSSDSAARPTLSSANPCFMSPPPAINLIRKEECDVQGCSDASQGTSSANPMFVSPSAEEASASSSSTPSAKSKESYLSRLSNLFKRTTHNVSRPDCLEKSGELHSFTSDTSSLSSSFSSSLLNSSIAVSRSSVNTSSHLSSLPEASDESGYPESTTDSFRMARDDPERASLGSTSSHEITVN